MGAPPSPTEILATFAALEGIVAERDYLRNELYLAKQVITEFELQNSEYDRLLANAHKLIRIISPERGSVPPPSPPHPDWIGTWLSAPLDYPTLLPVEQAWRNGHLQKALIMMPALLAREDLGPYFHVNCRLLYSSLIQSGGSNLPLALQCAEGALQIGTEQKLHQLVGKAHFHCGLCYLYMGEPAKAKWCFGLSSHLNSHEVIIEECRLKAEREIDALDETDPRRSVNFEV